MKRHRYTKEMLEEAVKEMVAWNEGDIVSAIRKHSACDRL